MSHYFQRLNNNYKKWSVYIDKDLPDYFFPCTCGQLGITGLLPNYSPRTTTLKTNCVYCFQAKWVHIHLGWFCCPLPHEGIAWCFCVSQEERDLLHWGNWSSSDSSLHQKSIQVPQHKVHYLQRQMDDKPPFSQHHLKTVVLSKSAIVVSEVTYVWLGFVLCLVEAKGKPLSRLPQGQPSDKVKMLTGDHKLHNNRLHIDQIP